VIVIGLLRNIVVENMVLHLRISNKYGSLTRNKFLMKSVTTLKYNDVPIFKIRITSEVSN
jgi:hypothetical protein